MIKTSEFVDMYRKGKVSAATLIKMAAFKEELENAVKEGKLDGLMKSAAFPETTWVNPVAAGSTFFSKFKGEASRLFGGMSTPLATAIVGGAILGGSTQLFMELVKKLENKIIEWRENQKEPQQLEAMLQVHPDMRELPPDRVKLYFHALTHFSPSMAENPLAAGAYIKQAMKYDHVAQGPLPASIQELSMIEKNRQQALSQDRGDSLMTTVLTPMRMGVEQFGKPDKK